MTPEMIPQMTSEKNTYEKCFKCYLAQSQMRFLALQHKATSI